MKVRNKRLKEALKTVDLEKTYSPREAIEILKGVTAVKFDQTLEVCLKLGVDPKKADQQIRSTVSLPHGTGKKSVILVFAKGDKEKEAKDAGADFVGSDDLAERIVGGWMGFSSVIATPDMMRVVGRLGKVLGPRGLMPSPKSGTVTQDVAKAVTEIKAGKFEFRVDKSSNIHTRFGKLSFSSDQLVENYGMLLDTIIKNRPSSVKGNFIRSISMSSTMGPGLKIDFQIV